MSPLDAIRAKGLSPDELRAKAGRLEYLYAYHPDRLYARESCDLADLCNLEADAQEVSREAHARLADGERALKGFIDAEGERA